MKYEDMTVPCELPVLKGSKAAKLSCYFKILNYEKEIY